MALSGDMEFRRGDERRRRVLRDEMLTPSDSSDGSKPHEDGRGADSVSGRTYSDAALVQYQPRVSCVIPKRIWGMLAVLLAGGAAISGIELLYAKVLPLATPESVVSLVMLDLTTTGSLASWFATLTLFLGTLGCVLVYSIRRHRLDDYRGRYGVWLWAGVAFWVASFDAATHAHQALVPLLVGFTGTRLLADGAIWGSIVLAVLFGSVMIRLAFEVWSCRTATSFVTLAAISYVASAVFTHHQPLHNSVAMSEVITSTTLLSAHFSLLYAVLVFARHVYLEAQGERRSTRSAVPNVTAKSKAMPKRSASTNHTAPAKSKSVRLDNAHEPKTAPAKKQPAAAPVRAAQPESERPMSKAERRRLRKLERRQKRNGAESDV
ncbi:MAG: hypothetical protein CMJ64_30210 [Planctomycetaceae bacterium]|nr:hypothetical protein [Planctomycetaceae bacterium]